jgi:hypothetical protein
MIKALESKLGYKIIFVNPASKSAARAFVVAKMSNEAGEIFYFGRYLTSSERIRQGIRTDNNMLDWDENSFESLGYYNSHKNRLSKLNLDFLPDAYKLAIKNNDWTIYDNALITGGMGGATKISKTSLLPTAVLANYVNVSPKDIAQQIEKKFGDTMPDLVEVTNLIARGTPGPWTLPKSMRGAFIKEYCEVLQPMAICSGALSVPFNASTGLITFNSGGSEKFIDSKIVVSGVDILVSTKKDKGTNSSLSGITNYFANYLDSATSADLKKYAKEIKILQIILDPASKIKPVPGNIGILRLPVLLKLQLHDGSIFNKTDAEIISKLDRTKPGALKNQGLDNPIPPDTPSNIIDIIKQTNPSPKHGPSPYYQSLYWVMSSTAELINKDPKMSELLRKVLDQANFVLVATIVSGDTFNFKTKKELVTLTPGESYHPHEAKKKLSFNVQ